ncbi:MAG: reverse transcriptase domain-containing protein [Candidatus Thermoplasmatota archaeon]|nr:reverse transcriptase domain-containing protein [Candidatus Thermoplasmatota archaeon]
MLDLYEEVCSVSNLEKAYMALRKKGTRQRKELELETKSMEVRTFLGQLRNDLVSDSYLPDVPLIRSKKYPGAADKEIRFDTIGIRDQIVEHAIKNILSHVYENTFLPFCCAYRYNKGEKYFCDLVERAYGEGLVWVLSLDVRSYSSSIDNDIILDELMKVTNSARLVGLIMKCMFLRKGEVGIMPGHVLSPLLYNAFLHPVDLELRYRRVIRYADNYFFVRAEPSGFDNDIILLSRLLDSRRLALNESKSRILLQPDPISLLL